MDSGRAPHAEDLALERFFPGIARQLGRVVLTSLPTPVRRLDRLAREVANGRLWIKHDDQSGDLYGGNKPRKLEFLLGDAVAKRRSCVLTFGGLGTNHGLATTISARRVGLRTILVLVPQPVTDSVRRSLLLHYAYGAEMHFAASVPSAALITLRLCGRELLRGSLPMIIPTGGSSALGAVGYVNAAAELAGQVRAGELPEPDYVFVPIGSGGTIAGLVLGFKLLGLRSRVVGTLVTDILPPSNKSVAALANACLRRLRRAQPRIPETRVAPQDFDVVRGWLGRCYGDPTEEAVRAVALAKETEGVTLETTYSGKCMAALLSLAREPPYRGCELLFWDTYSSVDPAKRLDRLPDFHELPPAFHRFFR
jgi:D-cysteine desulfhydrase